MMLSYAVWGVEQATSDTLFELPLEPEPQPARTAARATTSPRGSRSLRRECMGGDIYQPHRTGQQIISYESGRKGRISRSLGPQTGSGAAVPPASPTAARASSASRPAASR